MFDYECAECSQKRLITHHYTSSLSDNTKCDIDTAAGRQILIAIQLNQHSCRGFIQF